MCPTHTLVDESRGVKYLYCDLVKRCFLPETYEEPPHRLTVLDPFGQLTHVGIRWSPDETFLNSRLWSSLVLMSSRIRKDGYSVSTT